MFEEIFFPRTAERYRAAPLVEPRGRYLVHLRNRRRPNNLAEMRQRSIESRPSTGIARRRPGQHSADRGRGSNLGAAKGTQYARAASPKARAHFVSRGIQWLRFLGWLDEPEHERHPHHAEVAIFEKWLRQERGLSTATIQDYCAAADHFFFWLAGKGHR